MANCNEHKNPLIHNGTSQIQRLLPGMDKFQYAKVDEKEFADWIVFANKFAEVINYYDNSNTVSGNWQPFFSNDISAQLGSIAIQNINRYQYEIKKRFDFIRNNENKLLLNQIKIKLTELFSAIVTLSKSLDNYLKKLPENISLKNSLLNLIKAKLSPSLGRLIGYYKAAEIDGLLSNIIVHDWIILNIPLTEADLIINTEGLSEAWFDNSSYPTWTAYKESILPDKSIFSNPLDDNTKPIDERIFLNIGHAANHNLFTSIFDIYLSGFAKIISEAEKELMKSLESYDLHTPHFALFLSFLMLFRYNQQHINTITQRHLDFYYRDILRLQPRAPEANNIHILVELAKQADEHMLEQGTLLKAGKDSLKNEVSYQLDRNTVFNKAKVAQLKTVYKADENEKTLGDNNNEIDNTGRLFASPVANSDNGIDIELTSINKEWHPFVHKVYDDGRLQTIAMPKARIGFALASHYLYLTEGERKVCIRLALNNNSALNGKRIECYLTTEKEWYKVESLNITSTCKIMSDETTPCAEISFTIPGSVPAIVSYNPEKHGETFTVALPILKIYLENKDDSAFEYESLKDITINKIEIRVEVGMDSGYNQNGLKNLLLSNELGTLDVSKPFLPFGSNPGKDAGFIIGNKEIFCKKNTSLKLNIEWADLPDSEYKIQYIRNNNTSKSTPACTLKMFAKGKWIFENENGDTESSVSIFNGISPKVQIFPSGQKIPDSVTINYEDNYSPLEASSVNGFINLTLSGSFGYEEYLKDYSLYIIEKSPDILNTITTEPIEPYTPKIKSLYVSYSAYSINDLTQTSESSFINRDVKFFHLYPFGYCEQHKYLNPFENLFLLPQFKHTKDGLLQAHSGEFYIGIENLQPNKSVTLLFQIMEGTAEPLIIKPPEHINWAVLGDNYWIEIEPSEYTDNTLQWVQSGIISFKIPPEATTNNTLLPSGYIWLRASIINAAEAICKIITVNAQAASATFLDKNNAKDFLNAALPAETVSKLKNPVADIKKIIQPYPSFGGRAEEDDTSFYIRVSERLRHKSRAVTIWDYEHMVLEAFPEIYKIKCMNHTHIDDGIYHEVRPGHVSIITIPSIQNRNDSNPLKPFTQQKILTKIENYIKKHISCFVKIHVCQPQFEEIKMEFSVKFLDQYSDLNFYKKKLQEEITHFLSPWAYENSSSIDFGGKVYKSVLINFIEERYYVDFITDVKMRVLVGEIPVASDDMDEITASTARSILVSVPASQHVINPIFQSDNSEKEICIEKIIKTN